MELLIWFIEDTVNFYMCRYARKTTAEFQVKNQGGNTQYLKAEKYYWYLQHEYPPDFLILF